MEQCAAILSCTVLYFTSFWESCALGVKGQACYTEIYYPAPLLLELYDIYLHVAAGCCNALILPCRQSIGPTQCAEDLARDKGREVERGLKLNKSGILSV